MLIKKTLLLQGSADNNMLFTTLENKNVLHWFHSSTGQNRLGSQTRSVAAQVKVPVLETGSSHSQNLSGSDHRLFHALGPEPDTELGPESEPDPELGPESEPDPERGPESEPDPAAEVKTLKLVPFPAFLCNKTRSRQEGPTRPDPVILEETKEKI
uniref:Uncharacterized protein n=1 Tax=Poecilia latipinna TaxID=48699 RepID=A0A3B3UYC9_9TELE